MGKGSRQKGARAELEIANMLETWWGMIEPKAIFKRTPLSGGWGGADARAAFRSAGDIMTDSRTFPFAVEVKRREGWSWKPLIAGKASPIWGWWAQARQQAAEMSLVPSLWFRKSREDWHIMLPFWHVEGFNRSSSSVQLPVLHSWSPIHVYTANWGIRPVIVEARHFLAIPPELFRDEGWYAPPEKERRDDGRDEDRQEEDGKNQGRRRVRGKSAAGGG